MNFRILFFSNSIKNIIVIKNYLNFIFLLVTLERDSSELTAKLRYRNIWFLFNSFDIKDMAELKQSIATPAPAIAQSLSK